MRPHALHLVPLVLLVLLTTSVPGAEAFHDEELPILHSATVDRSAWVSYLFETDGAKVVAHIGAYDTRNPLVLGAALYDEVERLQWSAWLTVISGHDGLYVDANPVANQNVHVDLTNPGPESPGYELGVTVNPSGATAEPRVGKYKLLLWHGGSAGRVSYELRGGEGVSCVNVEEGSGTFAYTSRDFAGLANVHAGAPVTPAGEGARLTADVQRGVTVADTLIAIYAEVPGAYNEDMMSVDTPDGSRTCPCAFFSFVADDFGIPRGPGNYVFRNTGVGARGAFGEFYLAGADARLADTPAGPAEVGCSSSS